MQFFVILRCSLSMGFVGCRIFFLFYQNNNNNNKLYQMHIHNWYRLKNVNWLGRSESARTICIVHMHKHSHTSMYICTKKNIHYRRHTEVLNNFRLLFSFLLHFFFARLFCWCGFFFLHFIFCDVCRWLNFNKNAKTVFQNFKSEINNKQEATKKRKLIKYYVSCLEIEKCTLNYRCE